MSKEISKLRRAGLLGSAATLVASFAMGVGVTAAQAQDADSEEEVEEVTVTGSRIVRRDLEAAAPLQVFDSAAIEVANQTNIGDFLTELPSIATATNRFTTSFSVGAAGLSTVDLRNLGPQRTLTLQNGRRIVAGSPGSSAVDMNMIPGPLIERVEVVTGGGTASYGSDAVGGVINFILKDDFEGIEANVRQQWTEVGAGDDFNASLLIGSNFDDDKGNMNFFVSYSEQEAAPSTAFSRSAVDQFRRTGTDSAFDVSRPSFSSGSIGGTFFAGPTPYTILGDGSVVPFDRNSTGPAGGFNRAAFRTVGVPVERLTANANVKYQITDDINLYSELSYARYEATSEIEPLFFSLDEAFPDTVGLPVRYENSAGDLISNPFIPQDLIDLFDAAGDESIFAFRRLVEFGPRQQSNLRQTFRWAGGLQGQMDTMNLRWELGYVYGSTSRDDQSQGQVDVQALKNSLLVELDANGAAQCVSADARALGCVPVNLFGPGNVSQEAVNWIASNGLTSSKIEQNIVHGYVSGDLLELPAGPLGFAVGFEYREEESSEVRDSLAARGLNAGNQIFNTEGSYHVTEGFLEVNAPIIDDGVVEYLGVNGSIRVSDYSSVGTTETYHGGVEFAPVEDIRFRASYARTVRAPNIDELFSAGGQTFATITDACNGVTAETTGVIADNCRLDPAIAARIAEQGSFTLTQPEAQGTGGLTGANPVVASQGAADQLREEKADIYTVGAVFTPSFLPDSMNLTMTVDYFDIKVKDAISGVGRQTAIDLCYDSSNLSSPFCAQLERFPVGHPFQGALDNVNSVLGNVASIQTRGIDATVNYRLDAEALGLGEGAFTFSTTYTYLTDYLFQSLPGEPIEQDKGEINGGGIFPEHRAVVNFGYQTGGLSVNWQSRYMSNLRIDDENSVYSREACELAGRDCTVNSGIVNDLQVRYTLPESLTGSTSLEVYGGIENIFDKDAPFYPSGLPGNDPSSQTIGEGYNPLGRQFYLGLKVKL